MAQSALIRLEVPGHLDYRELVTRATSVACKVAASSTHPDDPESLATLTNELVSAVGEAFNNIAIHGYRHQPPGSVLLQIRFDQHAISTEISDYGASFDPHGVSAPDLAAFPESGMGLFIIQSFVDSIDYVAGTPNVLTLTKYLSEPVSSRQRPVTR